jgi:hypothetical protein
MFFPSAHSLATHSSAKTPAAILEVIRRHALDPHSRAEAQVVVDRSQQMAKEWVAGE